MLTALTGYLVSPRMLVVLTAKMDSTAKFAKKSESLVHFHPQKTYESRVTSRPFSLVTYDPMILELMEVLAAFTKHSLPKVSTLIAISLAMNLHASLEANL